MKKLIPCCIFLALTGCNNADQEAATTQPVEQPTPIATTSEPSAPPAPSVSYESLLISGDAAGPFTVENDGFSTLNYSSRAGALNLMEAVTQDYEYLGYLTLESAYQFGPDNYVVIVSTGEGGRSCPATTYAIAFDARGEHVTGSTSIDGCSETVQSFAEGNKLMIKKEGDSTVIYNAHIE
tara:strand:+ start:1124 stop:1666 length:543 start_codon:yes stop_codon:yes gene_type:complete